MIQRKQNTESLASINNKNTLLKSTQNFTRLNTSQETESTMKNSTSFFCFLLLCALLLSNSFIEPSMAKIYAFNCQQSCGLRCAKAGMKDRCMKYCGICCAKCKCVPSGTFGNKHECPCYRDYRNSKGKPKCP